MNKQFKAIDWDIALPYIAKLIAEEIGKINIGSEKRLGQLMGINQGTISKLKLEKYDYAPDFYTLQAVAFYFGYSFSEFMKVLEEKCGADLNTKEQEYFRFMLGQSAIYNTTELKKLSQLGLAIASQINATVMSSQKEIT